MPFLTFFPKLQILYNEKHTFKSVHPQVWITCTDPFCSARVCLLLFYLTSAAALTVFDLYQWCYFPSDVNAALVFVLLQDSVSLCPVRVIYQTRSDCNNVHGTAWACDVFHSVSCTPVGRSACPIRAAATASVSLSNRRNVSVERKYLFFKLNLFLSL